MIFVNCPFLKTLKCVDVCRPVISTDVFLQTVFERTGIRNTLLSAYCGHHQLHSGESIPDGSTVHLVLQLPGGKGGFGSMLRAIGAQIEKTTNREACRDLTGRRLRDINEEQRLKKWLAKKAEREVESALRRKQRLERLKEPPKHDFHDPEYNKKRSELPERIDDALTKGLQKSAPGKKRSRTESADDEPCLKKECLSLGVDVSSDSENSDHEQPGFSGSCSGASAIASHKHASVDGSMPSTSRDMSEESGSEISQNEEEIRVPDSVSPISCDASVNKTFEGEGNHASLSVSPVPHGTSEDNEKCGNSEETVQQQVSDSELSIAPHTLATELEKTNSCPDETNGRLPDNTKAADLQFQAGESKPEESCRFDLLSFHNPKDLEELGLDELKSILISLGLKCGGTLNERAQRLWSVRSFKPEDYPSSLKAKVKKQK